jgi:hypothetical protein
MHSLMDPEYMCTLTHKLFHFTFYSLGNAFFLFPNEIFILHNTRTKFLIFFFFFFNNDLPMVSLELRR